MLLPDDRWFDCASPLDERYRWRTAPRTRSACGRGPPAASSTRRRRSATFTVDTVAPALTITAGPSGLTGRRSPCSSSRRPDATARFECTHVFPDGSSSTIACESGWNPYDFVDGVHRFEIAAIDAPATAAATSRVADRRHRSRPEPVSRRSPGRNVRLRCRRARDELRVPARRPRRDFAPCTSPVDVRRPRSGGLHVHAARRSTPRATARRRSRGRSPSPRRSRAATAAPEPVATPRPVATPTPTPQAGRPWSRGRSAAGSWSSGRTRTSSSSCAGRTTSRSARRSTPRTGGSR